MESRILQDIIIILLLAIGVLFIFKRIKLPEVVGFLLTGVLVGPNGLGLISSIHEVEVLAEVGVILLLFTIGIEFSLKNLFKIRKSVLLGGASQVFITVSLVASITYFLGKSVTESIFIGFLISLSSTAIVLKILQERDEVVSPSGQIAVAILIFQDLIVIPMMLVTPILAGSFVNITNSLIILVLKGAAVILLMTVFSRWVTPFLLHQIAKTRSRELFLFVIIAVCFGTAYLTSLAGLSLALGAFLAGLVVSESEYAHHAFGNVVPFRDLFTSFFFISIGMLLNVDFLFANVGLILLLALAVIFIKMLIVGFSAFILGNPLRTHIQSGFSLSQIGEFSFIVATVGLSYGLINNTLYQQFLAVAILSMIATPFMIPAAPNIADFIIKLPLPGKIKKGLRPISLITCEGMKKHLIIVGYGVNGRNVAQAAKMTGIPYVIIEMNPVTVRLERKNNEPINFGDATQEAALRHIEIEKASVIVIAVPSFTATARITALARRLNPNLHIVVRTRFVQNVMKLYELGADEVIPEEFETSLEIFSVILDKYGVNKEEVDRIAGNIRSDGYSVFRRNFNKDEVTG